jgi:hypothetical protein
MTKEKEKFLSEDELDEDDMESIRQVFFRDIVPKLKRLDARLGTLNCEFAGKKYRHWTIRFESQGSGFDIVDYEYDEDSEGIDLDL